MPKPKKKPVKKPVELDENGKPVKKKKGEYIPEPPKPLVFVDNDEAVVGALSWNNVLHIQKKVSVGCVTTTKYDPKTSTFTHLNRAAESKCSIMPQSNYFGQQPDLNKDPYDRRKVK
jgi:hypothetical protein